MLTILNRDIRFLRLFGCKSCIMPPKKIAKSHNQQPSIATFFKSEKRNNNDVDNVESEKTAKKPKVGGTGDLLRNSSLSPEQKLRMEDNKARALQKLQNRTLATAVDGDLGITWKKALESEFTKPYFQTLKEFLVSERKTKTIYPPEKDVFSWTRFCAIEDTKVVIIGQDPYHGPGQAHGLCFSVPVGVAPPPSLVNIYKELENDVDGFVKPGHGYLVGWASQGVLLLNACLTVVANQANSHKDKGWEKFTDVTIKWINSNLKDVVFLLWGKYAQKKASFVDKRRHHVLTCTHPSPLSAHRGFFGCKHFSKANEYLKSRGRNKIDWSYLPSEL